MSKSNRKIKSVTLRGKRYAFLKSGRLPKNSWGYCTDPADKKRMIKIHKELSDEQELEITVHEMLHGCFWDLDEEVISQVGKDIAKALWRLGYRKPE